VLAFVAFSHWLLDLPMHRADMPLLPMNFGHLPRMGFGLWRFPAASAALEAALVLFGAWFYWRAAKRVATSAGADQRRVLLVSSLILIIGLGILAMDVTS
jgi:Co/Zn/Cd efflux system component